MPAPNAPNLLRMTASLKIEEMRAYVAQAFTPEQVTQIVDHAFDEAVRQFPEHVRQEVERAVREVAQQSVKRALSSWTIEEEVRKALAPHLLTAVASAFAAASDYDKRHRVKP